MGAPGEQKAAVNADPAQLGELNWVLRAARCSAGFLCNPCPVHEGEEGALGIGCPCPPVPWLLSSFIILGSFIAKFLCKVEKGSLDDV